MIGGARFEPVLGGDDKVEACSEAVLDEAGVLPWVIIKMAIQATALKEHVAAFLDAIRRAVVDVVEFDVSGSTADSPVKRGARCGRPGLVIS
jgi:hypothetical protein